MVFNSSLPDKIVKIKFSQAPQKLNVSAYDVRLIPMSNKEQARVFRVPADQERSMLSVEFVASVKDYYVLQVMPSTVDSNICFGEAIFFVGKKLSGLEKTIFRYVIITLLVLILLMYLKYFHIISSDFEFTFKPVVLLIHSVTTPEEKNFISAFANYLCMHSCNVSTIYGSAVDPLEWCQKKYAECDVIVFIISEGLFLTLDPKHFRSLEVHHPYCRQLGVAGYIFHDQISRPDSDFLEKGVAKVCFPFSKKDHIPKWMEMAAGKCYMLPQEMNAFLCFIFNCRFIFSLKCMKHHSSVFNHNIRHSTEYHELIDKMKAVSVSVKADPQSEGITDALDQNQQQIEGSSDYQGCTDRTDPMPIIKALLNDSSTSVIVESEMNPSVDKKLLKSENFEFLKYLELLRQSETEFDLLFYQRVNKSICSKEFYLHEKSETDSLLNQIPIRHLKCEEELNLQLETNKLLIKSVDQQGPIQVNR